MNSKKAQSLIEYGLVIAVVAVIAVAVVQSLGTETRNIGQNSVNAVNTAGGQAQAAWCEAVPEACE